MAVVLTLQGLSDTIAVTGGPGNPRDFVGMYRPGDTPDKYLTWVYLANGKTSPRPTVGVTGGTVRLTWPNPTGIYETRLVSVTAAGVMKFEGSPLTVNYGSTTPPPPLAVPTAMTLSPMSLSVQNNSSSGTQLCTIAVTMSDGSTFSGTLSDDSPLADIANSILKLNKNLSSTDNGSYNILVSANQNNTVVSKTFALTVTASTTLSPDGTVITGGTGTLVTVDGTWTFGNPLPAPNTGYWQIIRNGVAWPSGGSSKMEVANGGKLYELGTGAIWYTWTNNGFQQTTDPTPDPITATPKTVTLTPSSANILDNAPSGTQMATISVAMSDSSSFSGSLTVTPSSSFAGISGQNLVTTRALTSADDGSRSFTVTATQNNASASSTFSATVVAPGQTSPDGTFISGGTGQLMNSDGTWTFGPLYSSGFWQIMLNGVWKSSGRAKILEIAQSGKCFHFGESGLWYVFQPQSGQYQETPNPNAGQPPFPMAITLNPSTVSLLDNTPAGVRICTVAVQMSDNSQFTGTLTTSDTDLFIISGSDVVTARVLKPTDDGTHSTTITATQGGQSASIRVKR